MTNASMRPVQWLAALACALAVGPAQAQSTQIATEYLLTFEAPLEPTLRVDSATLIVPVKGGGWVKGPKITGRLVSPGGDWVRLMPSGAARLDVRAVIQTDDNALIFMSYNGIVQHSKESGERSRKGEVLKSADVPYFVAAPTFQTASEKYAWLNSVQAIGKVVELKLGAGGYVRYDIYIVR